MHIQLAKCYNHKPLVQYFPAFFGPQHLTFYLRYLAIPLAGLIGITIKELELLAAPRLGITI